MNDRLIRSAVSDLLSQEELDDLPTQRPRTVRYDHGDTLYVIEVSRSGKGVALAIRPANKKPAARAPDPRAIVGKGAATLTEPKDGPKPRKSRASMRPARASAAPPPEIPIELDDRGPSRPKPLPPDLVAAAAAERETAARTTAKHASPRVPPSADPHAKVPPAPAPEPEVAQGRRPWVRHDGPKAIDELLRKMLELRASDLHLSAGNHPVLRVDGEIRFLTDRPSMSSADVEALVRPIMTEKAWSSFEELRDADFAYELAGAARFRVNVFQDRKGFGTVVRQIPMEILTAEKLGLPKACLDLCALSKGLVLVTGPTGSGKSTTLAAMIDHINRTRSDHIITIEDPVEFVHPNQKCLVNQREVGDDTMSFKNALRAALREDPDIVLVGELRDLETIAIAIETAETGHLVFGTLHTTTAVSTVDRLIDQFPADRQAQIRVMLSESLKGVIAQVLCKKIGGGRAAALEVLIGTTAVSAMIRDGKTFQMASVMQTSKNVGMMTMNESLFGLVQRRQVDPKEAWMKAVDKTGFLSMLKNANIPTPFAG
ncbi:MAG: type IV pilus twitching motility protein PilT [Deltaproteobacteria bacterium]|nr:type IV pilus twitching motility protein PilT [Deltaproteobacteria bacterium]